MAMTMHGGNGDEAEVMVEINTTPLIDVMLVLLIMLILTIPIQTHAVKLDMPTDAPAQPQQTTPTIVQIDVAPDGSLAWNGEPVATRAQLKAGLRQSARTPHQLSCICVRTRRRRIGPLPWLWRPPSGWV